MVTEDLLKSLLGNSLVTNTIPLTRDASKLTTEDLLAIPTKPNRRLKLLLSKVQCASL